MERKEFKDVKQGDWIFTIQNGWERVTEVIKVSDNYPINTTEDNYTLDGKRYDEEVNPSAWTYDPFNDTQPPFEPKKGQVICGYTVSGKCYIVFSHMVGGAFVSAGGSVFKEARALNDEELGI